MTDLEQYARALAEQHGLDPDFVANIGKAESNWKADAVSKKGALGPMQLMPATAKQLGVNPADPFDNIRGGVQYLAQLQKQFGGDPSLTAAAYNAGPGAVAKAGGVPNYPETQAYVAKVTKPPEIDAGKVQWDTPVIDASKVQWDTPKAEAPSEKVGPAQAAAISMGGMVDRLAAGLRGAVPDNARNAIDALGQKLGMGAPPSADPATYAAANGKAMSDLRQQQPLASLAGELPIALAARTPLVMGAMGALEIGTPEERAIRGAGGVAGGYAGQALAKVASRAITPFRGAGEEAVNATKSLLDKYGVTGLPGQITGSAPLKWMESTLANLPGGGAIRQNIGAQQQGLGRATMNAIGGSGSAVTPEAVQAAQSAVGSSIGSIPKGVVVKTDDTLLNALGDVESRYANKLDALQKPVVQKLIDQLSSMPSMSGEFYQATRSDLSRMAAGAQGGYKDALTGIYKAMDRAFDRSAGSDAASAMQSARGQYSTGKVIEKMATETGNISPARLANAAKNLPPAGRELASLAETMRPLPNSGTAPRLAVQALLSGGVGTGYGFATGDPMQGLKAGLGAAGAQLAGPWLASQLLTRAPSRAYLTNSLLSPEAEKILMRLGAGSGGLLGLLPSR